MDEHRQVDGTGGAEPTAWQSNGARDGAGTYPYRGDQAWSSAGEALEPPAEPLALLTTAPQAAVPNATAQPIGTQPATAQPIGTQPMGAQPMGAQPIGTQPAATQPAGDPHGFAAPQPPPSGSAQVPYAVGASPGPAEEPAVPAQRYAQDEEPGIPAWRYAQDEEPTTPAWGFAQDEEPTTQARRYAPGLDDDTPPSGLPAAEPPLWREAVRYTPSPPSEYGARLADYPAPPGMEPLGPPPARPAGPEEPAGLPQRVPAEPDVPEVPDAPPGGRERWTAPELAWIADQLKRVDMPEVPEEWLDVDAVVGAVREVPGVRSASVRPNPNGVHTLRLDLADDADPGQVSRVVARMLEERMGLSAAPQESPAPSGRLAPPPPAAPPPTPPPAAPPPAAPPTPSPVPQPPSPSPAPQSPPPPVAPPAGPRPAPSGLRHRAPEPAEPESPDPPPGYRPTTGFPSGEYGRSEPAAVADRLTEYETADHRLAEHRPAEHRPPEHRSTDHRPRDYGPAEYAPAEYAPADYAPADYGPADYGPAAQEPPQPEPEAGIEDPAAAAVEIPEVVSRPLYPPQPGLRVVIDQVLVSTVGLDATVEVQLIAGDRHAQGLATGPAVDSYVMRLAAVSAANAIDSLLQQTESVEPPPGMASSRCFVEHTGVVLFGTTEVAVVVLLLVCGGWVEQLTGSALVDGDPRQAMVRATLGAVNRRLEALLG